MLFNLDQLMNKDFIILLLLRIPIVLFSLSFHEAAHAFVAHKMGDDTAKNLGRLTLNPLKHIDPIGTLCLILFGIGWAKPVPVMTRNFEHPKRGMILTAAAGPLSNVILSVIGVILYVPYVLFIGSSTPLTSAIGLFLYIFHYLNLVYAVFNLIPVPPLDGSRLFLGFLPDSAYFGIMRYEQFIKIGFLVLIMVFHNVLNFSPISIVCEFISGIMINVTSVPFALISSLFAA
ncbi:MAG: site-2 protease family protein [Clostridia bacterium]|nr:site-2 protease family protein [Clostridia bacterium]